MDTAAWIVQILLAGLFLMAGLMKVSQPYDKIAARMGWANSVTPAQVRVIGLLEVLGAIGLILPMLSGILPWLTPLAALGLALTMVGAALLHVSRREYPPVAMNIVLMALALFVAYTRFAAVPVA